MSDQPNPLHATEGNPKFMKIDGAFPCCGTKFAHCVRILGEWTPEAVANAGRCLGYWLQTRTERHECALVAPDSQLGLRPHPGPTIAQIEGLQAQIEGRTG